LLALPGADDGYVIDTPGLREVGVWELPAGELDQCFPELRRVREQCRFADCRHVAEPGCAVRDAVDSGGISPERYDSYRRLLEEMESAR
jgi:ribosome biogenesis GTPase